MPTGNLQFDGVTRVSSLHTLLKSAIFHYCSLEQYYGWIQIQRGTKKEVDKFVEAWEALDMTHWILVQEMEMLMRGIAKYSMGASQRLNCLLASEMYVWRKVAVNSVDDHNWKTLPLVRREAFDAIVSIDSTRKREKRTSLSE